MLGDRTILEIRRQIEEDQEQLKSEGKIKLDPVSGFVKSKYVKELKSLLDAVLKSPGKFTYDRGKLKRWTDGDIINPYTGEIVYDADNDSWQVDFLKTLMWQMIAKKMNVSGRKNKLDG